MPKLDVADSCFSEAGFTLAVRRFHSANAQL